jgi:Fe-S-cluster-containing dehydrogenase component
MRECIFCTTCLLAVGHKFNFAFLMSVVTNCHFVFDGIVYAQLKWCVHNPTKKFNKFFPLSTKEIGKFLEV